MSPRKEEAPSSFPKGPRAKPTLLRVACGLLNALLSDTGYSLLKGYNAVGVGKTTEQETYLFSFAKVDTYIETKQKLPAFGRDTTSVFDRYCTWTQTVKRKLKEMKSQVKKW